jgi:hypothetical protein
MYRPYVDAVTVEEQLAYVSSGGRREEQDCRDKWRDHKNEKDNVKTMTDPGERKF